MQNLSEESTWKCCKCGAVKAMTETDCLTRAKGYRGGNPSLATCIHERCRECHLTTPTPVPTPQPELVSEPSFLQSLGRSNTVKAASIVAETPVPKEALVAKTEASALEAALTPTLSLEPKLLPRPGFFQVLSRSNTVKPASAAEASVAKEALVAKAEPSALESALVKKKGWGWGKKAVPDIETPGKIAETSLPVAETQLARVPTVHVSGIVKTKAPSTKEDHAIPEAPEAKPGWSIRAKSEAAEPITKEDIPNQDTVQSTTAKEIPAPKKGWGWWATSETSLTTKESAMAEATTAKEEPTGEAKPPITFEETQLSRNYAYTPYEPPALELPDGLYHAWECCACQTGRLHRVRPENEICQLLLGRSEERCPHRRCKDCVKRVLRGVFYD